MHVLRTPCVCRAHRGQKKVSKPLALELETSYHVCSVFPTEPSLWPIQEIFLGKESQSNIERLLLLKASPRAT